MKSALFFCLVILTSTLTAADLIIADVKLPVKIVYDKKTLQLNGSAIRKVSMFNVKVWVSALYVESSTSSASELIESKTTKIIDLHALYDVTATDSIKGWRIAFDDNCESKCSVLAPEIQRFYKSVPTFKKGTIYRYVFTAEGVKILLENQEIFSSANQDFRTLLLKTWIGPKPPSEDVKKSLLKGFVTS